jgi:hypothetical protein
VGIAAVGIARLPETRTDDSEGHRQRHRQTETERGFGTNRAPPAFESSNVTMYLQLCVQARRWRPDCVQLVTCLLLQHPPADARNAHAFRGPNRFGRHFLVQDDTVINVSCASRDHYGS